MTMTVAPTTVHLGDTITVSGTLSPSSVNPTTIQLRAVRSDLTVVAKNIVTNASGIYSADLTVADMSGAWTISATWGGGSGFGQQTRSQGITVGGFPITFTANLVDMISLTLIPSSTDPAVVFGGSSIAAQIRFANWIPAIGAYYAYPADSGFQLRGGSGYWIKPQFTGSIEAQGQLWPQTQPYAVDLDTGWNQIGSVYVAPIAWNSLKVSYQGGQAVSISTAAANGWIKNYAWKWDTATRQYVLATVGGTIDPGRGYWVRALVDCQLILTP
ncbi:MAG: hypothetical protein WCL39_07610, partial [Armatimonadota bacterium]